MAQQDVPIPTAHVDDERATVALTETLTEIHGPTHEFAVERWESDTMLDAPERRIAYHVVIDVDGCSVTVSPDDLVRGSPPGGPYRRAGERFSRASAAHTAAIWPGDVITVRPEDDPVELTGAGIRFVVRTDPTPYTAARFCFLRNIKDAVGGCAEYADAFRREVLPPEPSEADDDARGVNRINEHTIDMRHDREPEPVQHHHAPVTTGDGERVAHTETAIVLDRSTYDLPPVADSDEHIRIFRRPTEDAADWVDLAVEPGSIVVTPATDDQVYGHCFQNTFAILVAVPSFTAPLVELGKDKDRAGESHRKYHE